MPWGVDEGRNHLSLAAKTNETRGRSPELVTQNLTIIILNHGCSEPKSTKQSARRDQTKETGKKEPGIHQLHSVLSRRVGYRSR